MDTALTKTSEGAVLTLDPSEAFLADPTTNYPVTIDPTWSATNPDDTWIGSGAPDAIHPGDETLNVGTPNGDDKYRSLVIFNRTATKPWVGQSVTSATLKLRNFNALTCSGSTVEARRLTSNWKPGTATWSNRPAGTDEGAAASSAAYGYASGCPSADMSWNVTQIAKAWANGSPYYGFLIRASDESKKAGYREFRSAGYSNTSVIPRLSVTYNSYPRTPGTPTFGPGSAGYATSLTPTLKSVLRDPDGGSLSGIFTITLASTGTAVWSGRSAAVPSGGTASITVPNGKLSNGVAYKVRVTADDGNLNSKADSGSTKFTVKLPPSSPDPVIQQILNLSDPGTTEADVTSIVNGIIAGSHEDGETIPLTFDEAKQELLTSLTESLDDTQEVPNPPTDSTCEWSVQADASGLTVAHEGTVESLAPVALPEPDPTAPVYTGSVDGDPVTVTVLKGTPEDEISTSLADSEGELDTLGADSISQAVDGEQDDEVEQEFTDLPHPSESSLETVAYSLETGDTIERGVPEQGLTDAEMESAAEDPTRECVHAISDQDVGAELDTEQGRIIIASRAEMESDDSAMTPQARTYGKGTSAVRYRTFIPFAQASTGWVCGKFRGDDRNFTSYYDASNRTRASAFFNWNSQTVDTTKHVGTTHRLKGYGRSAKAKTASSSGIKFHDASIGAAFGRISVTHSVGNPLCSVAGAIKYNIVIEVWKKGAARISGTRVKVPNHEAYLYPKTGEFGDTILQKSTSHFYCLSINCGQETIRETTD